jgi:hypothetical protein
MNKWLGAMLCVVCLFITVAVMSAQQAPPKQTNPMPKSLSGSTNIADFLTKRLDPNNTYHVVVGYIRPGMDPYNAGFVDMKVTVVGDLVQSASAVGDSWAVPLSNIFFVELAGNNLTLFLK